MRTVENKSYDRSGKRKRRRQVIPRPTQPPPRITSACPSRPTPRLCEPDPPPSSASAFPVCPHHHPRVPQPLFPPRLRATADSPQATGRTIPPPALHPPGSEGIVEGWGRGSVGQGRGGMGETHWCMKRRGGVGGRGERVKSRGSKRKWYGTRAAQIRPQRQQSR